MQVEAWLQRAARSAPARTALQTPRERVSYAELWRAARAGADELVQRGARPGQPVAIALTPGIAFARALHACMLLGAPAVPVDLRLTARERARTLAGATVVVDQPLRVPAPSVRGSAPARPGSPGFDDNASAADAATGAASASASDAADDDATGAASASGAGAASAALHDLDAVCAVIHTSGTTSAPRPVELTYGNFLWSALGSGVALGVDPDERWLCALPLSHVGGLSILVRSAIYATTAVVHERFDTAAVLGALMEQRITLVSLVATTLARLLDAGLRDPPHLRCALTGGGPVPAALARRARAAGVPVIETYGLTECCSQAATAPLATLNGDIERAVDGGRAAAPPRTTAERPPDAAADPDAAAHVGAGVPLFCTRTDIAGDGEILLSGPTVARSAIAGDGRLHSGDLGRIDAGGFLHVVGRKADTIVSGGENVAPSEVEAVLEAHPAVIEAAVVGREDPRWGEAVTAIVVVAPGASVGESALREHCAAHLAPFKVPKRVRLVATPLPRTRSGKLLRRDLQGIGFR